MRRSSSPLRARDTLHRPSVISTTSTRPTLPAPISTRPTLPHAPHSPRAAISTRPTLTAPTSTYESCKASERCPVIRVLGFVTFLLRVGGGAQRYTKAVCEGCPPPAR
eukprot:9334697-Pyramimonas_sp.AAC.1